MRTRALGSGLISTADALERGRRDRFQRLLGCIEVACENWSLLKGLNYVKWGLKLPRNLRSWMTATPKHSHSFVRFEAAELVGYSSVNLGIEFLTFFWGKS